MTSAFSWWDSVSLCPASFYCKAKLAWIHVSLDFLLLHSSPLWWKGPLNIMPCISLIIGDVEHLVPFGKNVSLAYLLLVLFVCLFCFCYCVLWALYIFCINPLSDIWFANTFSHSVGCLLILLMVSLAVQKAFSLFPSVYKTVFFPWCFLYFCFFFSFQKLEYGVSWCEFL